MTPPASTARHPSIHPPTEQHAVVVVAAQGEDFVNRDRTSLHIQFYPFKTKHHANGRARFFRTQMCSGDLTVLAEIAAELLEEGFCAGVVANPGMIMEAVEAVVNGYGGIKSFRKNVKNFAQFSVRAETTARVSIRDVLLSCVRVRRVRPRKLLLAKLISRLLLCTPPGVRSSCCSRRSLTPHPRRIAMFFLESSCYVHQIAAGPRYQ